MRMVFVVALLLVVLSWAATGCARSKPAGVGEQAEAPQPGSAKPSAAATVARDTGDEAGYEGAWGMVISAIVLEADGTGRMEAAYPDAEEATVTWRREEDHIVISRAGREMTAQLTADGSCLALAEDDTGMGFVCVRLDPAVREEMVEAAKLDAPAMERAKVKSEQARCLSNVKQLTLALMMYAADYDRQYPPPGADWEGVTFPYVKSQTIYRCPSDPEEPSYQFNPDLAGLRLDAVTQPAQSITLFESDDGKKVAYRHNDGANYGFGDGHCKWFMKGAEKAGDLIWRPGEAR